MEKSASLLETVSKTVQVLSIVIGLVVTILSFNYTKQKDAQAREAEANARAFEVQKYADQRKEAAERQKIVAAEPFLQLRQKLYLETVQSAAILANPDDHTPLEITRARKRFRELYVAELSMVEAKEVEGAMKNLAEAVDPQLLEFTPHQAGAYRLSHALRDSLVRSWKVDSKIVDNKMMGNAEE